MIPLLETERLQLVTPAIEHYFLYKRLHHKNTQEQLDIYEVNSSVWKDLCADIGSWYLRGVGIWVVKHKQTNIQLGRCGFWREKSQPTKLVLDLTAAAVDMMVEVELVINVFAYSRHRWRLSDVSVNTYNLSKRLQRVLDENFVSLEVLKTHRCDKRYSLENVPFLNWGAGRIETNYL